MKAEDAGIIPAGIFFIPTVFFCTGVGKSRLPRDFPAREQKTTGNHEENEKSIDIFWNCLDGEIKISSGTVWTAPRGYHVNDNCAGTGKKKHFPCNSEGMFPRDFSGARPSLFTVVRSYCLHQGAGAEDDKPDRPKETPGCHYFHWNYNTSAGCFFSGAAVALRS